MNCRHCGTDISEKALVCFRCGKPTAEPSGPRAPDRRGGRPGWAVVLTGLLVLVAAALFMSRAAAGLVPSSVSYAVAALAAVVLIWRLVRRRRA